MAHGLPLRIAELLSSVTTHANMFSRGSPRAET